MAHIADVFESDVLGTANLEFSELLKGVDRKWLKQLHCM